MKNLNEILEKFKNSICLDHPCILNEMLLDDLKKDIEENFVSKKEFKNRIESCPTVFDTNPEIFNEVYTIGYNHAITEIIEWKQQQLKQYNL